MMFPPFSCLNVFTTNLYPPTGNLDKQTSESIVGFLLDIHKRYRQTVLLVTHDMDVARCADEILLMEDGKLRFAMKAGEDL